MDSIFTFPKFFSCHFEDLQRKKKTSTSLSINSTFKFPSQTCTLTRAAAAVARPPPQPPHPHLGKSRGSSRSLSSTPNAWTSRTFVPTEGTTWLMASRNIRKCSKLIKVRFCSKSHEMVDFHKVSLRRATESFCVC